jgi:SAM-dependent methyltransferase
MEGWGISTYGDSIAEIYDELYEDLFADKVAQVELLAELARGGRALELAIGTGRIALPLAAKGVEVHGIDSSAEMVERLRAKPGGTDIPVSFGDFADVEVDGEFKLIYLIFNTLFALTTQEDQIRCFENVAKHLTDDGAFALSAFIPDMSRYERHQNVNVTDVGIDKVHVDFARHDPVNQTVSTTHLLIREGQVKMFPVFLRYAWPSEIDLMAKLAGLELKARYGDWDRSAFTSESKQHVSLYGKV